MRFLLIIILSFVSLRGLSLEFSDANIVIPQNSSPYLKFCAQELSSHLKMITGGNFLITDKPKSPVWIEVGSFPKEIEKKILTKRDSFAVIARGNVLYIVGIDTYKLQSIDPYVLLTTHESKGTLAGVHSFLEENGIRWLAPGDENTFVYKKKSLQIPEGCRITVPTFNGRCIAELESFGEKFHKIDGLEYNKGVNEAQLWAVRLRNNVGINPNCHTEQFLNLDVIWKDHPERFQLQADGKRNFRYLCWTDPAVEEMWEKAADAYFSGLPPTAAGLPHIKKWLGQKTPNIFSIDPMDHGSANDGRCRCPRCNEFRRQHPCQDDTEIMWQVIAKVAWKMKTKHPGKYIGTLVYPPKQYVPKTIKLPDNLKVRLCLPGPKVIPNKQLLEQDLATLQNWNELYGRDRLSLWTYQCECIGGKLPGPPETYPDYFAEYTRQIRPLVGDFFHEYHGLTFTYKLLETYLQAKLMWNPDADVQSLKKEHIALYYGPAATLMEQLFMRFEANWKQYWKEVSSIPVLQAELGTSRNGQQLRKIVWSNIYTKEEMNRCNTLLSQAEKAAGETIYRQRVARFRKYVFNVMVKERSEVMELSDQAPVIKISAASWPEQQAYLLISAHRDGTKLTAETRCKFKIDKGMLQIRILAHEPKMGDVQFNPAHMDGNPDLWQDSCLEIFFFIPANATMTHYIINTAGKISCLTMTTGKTIWSKGKEADYTLKKEGNVYSLDFTLPLSVLGKNLNGLRFNITRARNVKGSRPEFSTLSQAALLGNWDNPDSFAQIQFQ